MAIEIDKKIQNETEIDMNNTLKEKNERALKMFEIFKEVYGEGVCTLDYTDPLRLLIATQLSAQCTDARVNMITPALFEKYPDVYAFANADELELREDIKSTGFYRNKAKNIIGCCCKIISDFGGEVPQSMDELLSLPGVGRKTANLVLGEAFGISGVVVDTHATRLSNRMGFTENSDPYKIELDLLAILPEEIQGAFCHMLVHHGRAYCTARRANCGECPVAVLCPKILKD